MMKKHITAIAIATFTMLFTSVGCSKQEQQASNELRIPALIDSLENKDIQLQLRKGQHQFYANVNSETMGINADYLGPTIRLYNGSSANISFTNQIGETTTVHGHGLHVPGNIDGGPQLAIKPQATWRINIPVRQQAGMSWYHPHFMGKTAEHVHAGLAGIYLIEDENSISLNLPKHYGVNDIPLVIQDRTFINGKMKPYAVTHDQMMDGLREETLVVNGTVTPFTNVPQGWVRLRLLNGSNARFYRFYFENNETFYKIATEGGFLNNPVALQELTMSPGERNEIMLDLSNMDNIHLMAEFLPSDPDDQLFFMSWLNPTASVVELRVDGALTAQGELPKTLNDIKAFTQDDKDSANLRRFTLDMDDDGNNAVMDHHSMFSINGQSMKMNVINERVSKGQFERWSITAEMMPHPFHVHGVSFQILSHQGKPPAEADRGWKDTVVVGPEPTEVMMRFNHQAGEQAPYMYHCHILEHEDGGMMGQFTVK